MNTIYACILFKGHLKCKENGRLYRTISTCPLLAKALNIHIKNLLIDDWNNAQAETRYQDLGKSHELACVLMTETIDYSLYRCNKPVFAFFMDARSTFDRIVFCALSHFSRVSHLHDNVLAKIAKDAHLLATPFNLGF